MAEGTEARVAAPPRDERTGGWRGTLGSFRRRVADDLWPLAPPQRASVRSVVLLIAAVVVLTSLSLLRQTGPGALDTVWAEDGSIFLDGALDLAPWEALTAGYAGYLHLYPRLVAELAVLGGLQDAAWLFAVAGAASAAVSGVIIFVASAGHIRSPALRGLLAALVVVQPLAGPETLNSVALAQWHLVGAAVWVTLWRPLSWPRAAAAGLFLAVTVLSAPLAIGLAPILVARALFTTTWRDRLPALVYLPAMLAQAWAMLTQPAPNAPGGDVAGLLVTYVTRVVEPVVFGLRFDEALRITFGRLVPAVALLVVGGVLVWAVARSPRRRLTLSLLAACSLVICVASLLARGTVPELLVNAAGERLLYHSRFLVVPAVLLFSALAVAVDGTLRRTSVRGHQAVLAGSVGVALLVSGADFFVTNDRSLGPAWSIELADVTRECRSGRGPATAVDLQLSPPVEAFELELTCADVTAG